MCHHREGPNRPRGGGTFKESSSTCFSITNLPFFPSISLTNMLHLVLFPTRNVRTLTSFQFKCEGVCHLWPHFFSCDELFLHGKLHHVMPCTSLRRPQEPAPEKVGKYFQSLCQEHSSLYFRHVVKMEGASARLYSIYTKIFKTFIHT